MGNGAVKGLAAATAAASDEDLKAAFANLGEAERKKLLQAFETVEKADANPQEEAKAEEKKEEAKEEKKEEKTEDAKAAEGGTEEKKEEAAPAAEAEAEVKKEEAEEEKKGAGKKALIVSTSAGEMGDHKTGAWSEEICGPYYTFKDSGFEVCVCSIAGGDIPIDQGSLSDTFKTDNDKKMIEEEGSKPLLGTSALKDTDATTYDIVLFAGGHGTCVDFPTDEVGEVVSKVLAAGKVVCTVCHGAMALVKAKTEDGKALVDGKKVSCFTDKEEEQVKLTEKVPFLLETKLKELGANVEAADAWSDKVVQDGKLVTAQNPQSSVSCAKLAITLV